jgi:hypothetical protein
VASAEPTPQEVSARTGKNGWNWLPRGKNSAQTTSLMVTRAKTVAVFIFVAWHYWDK